MRESVFKYLSPILLLSLAMLVSLPSGTLAEVVLNELIAAPGTDWSGDGEIDWRDDEWVEIVNRGDSAVDLEDYWVSDEIDDPPLRYRFSGTLGPQQALFVTGAEALAFQADMGLGSGGLSLRNSGGWVALFCDTGGEPEMVDSVEYQDYQVVQDRALGRFPLDSEDWILFDGMNLYHGSQEPGSTGCMPSPGELNQCDVTPAQDEDWGRVKKLYGEK